MFDPGRLDAAASALNHRGPDEHGSWHDGNVGLAHTRLSIIDLAGGHQPLSTDAGRLLLVANGEIYNHVELRAELESRGHRFSTHSDCEVALHAYREYGDGFLEHLHGMYALALYDCRRGRLLLARDRLGIKPLFIRRIGDGLAFASELKALLPLGEGKPAIDPRGLAEYFAHQFIGASRTIWSDTEKLLPAEAVAIEDGQITRRWHYWDARQVERRDWDYEHAARHFDELFATVCREHLRADVPIGLFLSGGVDSAILAGRLHTLHSEPLQAYSVGFEELRSGDELPLAQAQARRLNIPLTALRPSLDDLLRALPRSIWAADELMRDPANLPTLLLAQAASQSHKVVFSGEGGDEVFAGYRRYRRRPEDRLKALLRPGSGGFRTRSDVAMRQRRALYGETLLEASRHHRSPFVEAWGATPKRWSNLQRRQYVDLMTALPDNLLVKADRMLMQHGVEGRVPFLDHRVVEFGLSLPDHLKLRDGHGKWFLKRWASRFIDKDFLFTPKRGFYVPLRQRFGANDIERLQRVLPDQAGVREWFHPQGVRTLLARDSRAGRLSVTALALLQFALWHQLFHVGDGTAPTWSADPFAVLGGASA